MFSEIDFDHDEFTREMKDRGLDIDDEFYDFNAEFYDKFTKRILEAMNPNLDSKVGGYIRPAYEGEPVDCIAYYHRDCDWNDSLQEFIIEYRHIVPRSMDEDLFVAPVCIKFRTKIGTYNGSHWIKLQETELDIKSKSMDQWDDVLDQFLETIRIEHNSKLNDHLRTAGRIIIPE